MDKTIILYTVLALLLGAFFWEHFARKSGIGFKPSALLNVMADNGKRFFNWIGTILAKISSFYTYIDLKDLRQTFYDLFKPAVDTITSPFWTIKGYVETMNIYDHPYLIILGSLTLTILTYLGLSYFFPTYRIFTFGASILGTYFKLKVQ